MLTINDFVLYLDQFAPPRLAADWDNVGLLVGSRGQPVRRVMTCLTITSSSAAEAVREKADVIVVHHPLPFRPLKRITDDSTAGSLLLTLIRNGIGVISPHTSFDSAAQGINQQLAHKLGLSDIRPLIPEMGAESQLGTGRMGSLAAPLSLEAFASRAASALGLAGVKVVGPLSGQVSRVAIGCGSAGDLLDSARRQSCHAFVTGEATFHTCLEAEAIGLGLVLLGHYASERFAVETLAENLRAQFPALEIWPSRDERDPLEWVEAAKG